MKTSAIIEALGSRKSVRQFLPRPVPKTDVARILKAARLAPSGGNLQPGRFHALTGTTLLDLSKALSEAAIFQDPASEYSYFPNPMPADLKSKQRAAGYALYEALGIDRRDFEGRKQQFDKNYRFFDAPVGIIVTIHKDMGKGCFMDLGMSLMALFMAAHDLGYGTTGIGAIAKYGPVAHAALGLNDDEMVVCGIALGVEDTSAPVNRFRTVRDDLDQFTTFRGFDTSG
ncbi:MULTISPECIES: nitroreductase family protein [Pacificibacter]|uniref:nitroreductase family protein n=1 Tax=Pacificibacter TaxID=1042323 RepID=UPI001C0977CE|nr:MULTISPECIES: nitroreductase family protein [Pacificibacter]MBU2937584.1 nitroreductase family protein [Pacificibacter marinus]MDO6617390.1 nitroreductase family protein [Pacificibacter sp. 1_MG-2023]